jgi:hypothetical protein
MAGSHLLSADSGGLCLLSLRLNQFGFIEVAAAAEAVDPCLVARLAVRFDPVVFTCLKHVGPAVWATHQGAPSLEDQNC